MINEQYAHKFCKDNIAKIENYEIAKNDTSQTWHCHHRLELTLDGEFANTRDDLKRLGMYFNRPYFELIFLTHSEHIRMHLAGKPLPTATRLKIREALRCNPPNKGKHHSAETRQKISKSNSGENHPFYGKHFSEEHRKNLGKSISKSLKGHTVSEETRQRMASAQKERWARHRQEK